MDNFDEDLYMRWHDFQGYLMHEVKFPVRYKSYIDIIPHAKNETALIMPKIPIEEFKFFLRNSLILSPREISEVISINEDIRHSFTRVFVLPLKYIYKILSFKTGVRVSSMTCSTYGAQIET